MERASPEAFLTDNSLVHACGPCSVDLSDNPDLGASFYSVLGVSGLQRVSSCANWSFNEGVPTRVSIKGGYIAVFFPFLLVSHGALFFVHKLSAHACSSIRAFDWGT